MNYQQKGAAKLVKLGIILAVFGILALGVLLMPKGFKDDLSVIGQGLVSVVLVHDKNRVASTETMELLNNIRSEYKNNVNFLAVDIDTPIGKMFVKQQTASGVDIIVFNKDGSRQGVLKAGVSEQQLRSVLNNILQQ